MEADKQRAGKEKELRETEDHYVGQWFELVTDGLLGVTAVMHKGEGKPLRPVTELPEATMRRGYKMMIGRDPKPHDNGRRPIPTRHKAIIQGVFSHLLNKPRAKEGGTPSPHPGVEDKY